MVTILYFLQGATRKPQQRHRKYVLEHITTNPDHFFTEGLGDEAFPLNGSHPNGTSR